MKKKLIKRLVKYKKDEDIGYRELSKRLGFTSAMTSHAWINVKLPAKNIKKLESFLKRRGY